MNYTFEYKGRRIIMKLLILLFWTSYILIADSIYYEYGKKVVLSKLPTQRVVNGHTIQYYQTQDGNKIGVKNEVIIKCDSAVVCQNIFNKYDLNSTKKLSEKFYLISVPKNQDLFELSSKLYMEDSIEMAHPNFVKKRFKR